jgi:hypothetical protein
VIGLFNSKQKIESSRKSLERGAERGKRSDQLYERGKYKRGSGRQTERVFLRKESCMTAPGAG